MSCYERLQSYFVALEKDELEEYHRRHGRLMHFYSYDEIMQNPELLDIIFKEEK